MTATELLTTISEIRRNLDDLSQRIAEEVPDLNVVDGDGLVPMIVFVTEDQFDSIQRLGMDLSDVMQNWLDDDIECYEDAAEEAAKQ